MSVDVSESTVHVSHLHCCRWSRCCFAPACCRCFAAPFGEVFDRLVLSELLAPLDDVVTMLTQTNVGNAGDHLRFLAVRIVTAEQQQRSSDEWRNRAQRRGDAVNPCARRLRLCFCAVAFLLARHPTSHDCRCAARASHARLRQVAQRCRLRLSRLLHGCWRARRCAYGTHAKANLF